MVLLGVNIDHIATLRQARRGREPDVLEAARIVEKSKAAGITVHLREDRRHIQDEDVIRIRNEINKKLNLEMSLAKEIVKFALRVKPDDVCIVPEKRQEITTEGGLDVKKELNRLNKVIPQLQDKGIRVSIFINPDCSIVKLCKEIGADCVELHTGKYAEAKTRNAIFEEYNRILKACKTGLKAGIIVNAGHGLNYQNTARITAIEGINELNIGHSIISRAVFVGLPKAIEEMYELIEHRRRRHKGY
ncbi:MAG: pyridoxine 5'-phosphate synthase [Candidatus Hydrogenedentota bacterium]